MITFYMPKNIITDGIELTNALSISGGLNVSNLSISSYIHIGDTTNVSNINPNALIVCNELSISSTLHMESWTDQPYLIHSLKISSNVGSSQPYLSQQEFENMFALKKRDVNLNRFCTVYQCDISSTYVYAKTNDIIPFNSTDYFHTTDISNFSFNSAEILARNTSRNIYQIAPTFSGSSGTELVPPTVYQFKKTGLYRVTVKYSIRRSNHSGGLVYLIDTITKRTPVTDWTLVNASNEAIRFTLDESIYIQHYVLMVTEPDTIYAFGIGHWMSDDNAYIDLVGINPNEIESTFELSPDSFREFRYIGPP